MHIGFLGRVAGDGYGPWYEKILERWTLKRMNGHPNEYKMDAGWAVLPDEGMQAVIVFRKGWRWLWKMIPPRRTGRR